MDEKTREKIVKEYGEDVAKRMEGIGTLFSGALGAKKPAVLQVPIKELFVPLAVCSMLMAGKSHPNEIVATVRDLERMLFGESE